MGMKMVAALIMEDERWGRTFLFITHEENEQLKKELREKVNTLEQELLLCKEENEKLKEELEKKVNTLEQDLLLCKEENEKLKEELREKVNTLEQDLLLCKEENEKFKEELREKVNTLEQELLLCKEENEKFKEELKKKDQQEWEKQTIDIKNNMEGLLIERPLISKTKRKLLILDVNGLFLHIGNKFDLPSNCIADKFISGKAICKRPSCVDFLKFCFQSPNCCFVGTNPIALLLGFYTFENNEKPLMLKELVKLWDKDDPNLPWEKREYNESSSLLVDDSPYKALLNPKTLLAIFPTSYDIRGGSLMWIVKIVLDFEECLNFRILL
ncbi:hypothetical protein IFM89_027112 [Coptis chinensis]|uniref:FCP1 homology domain-containing protein n=1 Tax=Coptis chinensis TaxID=261450 RepID=A0A835M6T3_9MAGN|nr:hypothetical protein IFM89_027112 [Coptis chinensis]